MTDRLDRLIATIREKYQKPALDDANTDGDILVVAHGHILRAFAMRWAGKSLQEGPAFLLEAGGVGTLRYAAIQQARPFHTCIILTSDLLVMNITA